MSGKQESLINHKALPILIAHRGSSLVFPENTLEAFKSAIEEKADIIECDLRITSDEQIVIFHDPRVKTSREQISNLSLSQVKQKKILYRHGSEWAEIPTLEELISLSKGKIKLALELKDPKFSHAKYAENLLNIIDLSGMLEQVIFISFRLDRLMQIKKLMPNAKTGYIGFRVSPSNSYQVDIECVLWPILYLNPYFVQHAHQMGRSVWAMDTIPKVRAQYYVRKKVDGILTNSPTQTYEYISKFIETYSG